MPTRPSNLSESRLTESLQEKWEREREGACTACGMVGHTAASGNCPKDGLSKTEQVTSTQPQGSGNVYENEGEGLDPVTAHKHSICYLCNQEVEPGDTIVCADGERWVHSECGVLEGWSIT